MRHGGGHVGRGVALAQLQDAAGVVRGRPWVGLDEAAQEIAGRLAEREEVLADDLQRSASAVQARWPVRGEHAVAALAPGQKLMVGDAGQVRPVDEELVLGDAHRQQRGHVLVGDAVPIAVPVDEALDRAQAVDDPRGVEGVLG